MKHAAVYSRNGLYVQCTDDIGQQFVFAGKVIVHREMISVRIAAVYTSVMLCYRGLVMAKVQFIIIIIVVMFWWHLSLCLHVCLSVIR